MNYQLFAGLVLVVLMAIGLLVQRSLVGLRWK